MPESQNTPVCFLQGNRDTILKQESVLCEAGHVGSGIRPPSLNKTIYYWHHNLTQTLEKHSMADNMLMGGRGLGGGPISHLRTQAKSSPSDAV